MSILAQIGFKGQIHENENGTIDVNLQDGTYKLNASTGIKIKKLCKPISFIQYDNIIYNVSDDHTVSIDGMEGCPASINPVPLFMLHVFAETAIQMRQWKDPLTNRYRRYEFRYPDREIDEITTLYIRGNFKDLARFSDDEINSSYDYSFCGKSFVNSSPFMENPEIVPYRFINLTTVDLSNCVNPKLTMSWRFFANPKLETLILPKVVHVSQYETPPENVNIVNRENVIYQNDLESGCCLII